jgi:hypothetical protein
MTPRFYHHINQIDQGIILTPPPHGHLGLILLPSPPLSIKVYPETIAPEPIPTKPLDLVFITVQGDPVTQGVITHVEAPGQQPRFPLTQVNLPHNYQPKAAWKIYWVPVYDLRHQTLTTISPKHCPSCAHTRSKVYMTEIEPTRIVRHRVCLAKTCSQKWITVELFHELFVSQRSGKSKKERS